MTTATKLWLRFAIARAVGWSARCAGRLRILTYHNIRTTHQDESGLPVALFEAQLACLVQRGYRTLRIGDLVDRWPAVLQERPAIALTFDDALFAHRRPACEILQKYGVRATFFVPTAYVDEQRRTLQGTELAAYRGAAMCSWQDLRDMAAAGFEIGAHSHTHPHLAQLPPERALEEVRRPKQLLEDKLGLPVRSFAYPFGHRDAFSPRTRALVAQAGYASACTQMGGPLTARSDLLELPRMGIDDTDVLPRFLMKVRGDYDCLRWLFPH